MSQADTHNSKLTDRNMIIHHYDENSTGGNDSQRLRQERQESFLIGDA